MAKLVTGADGIFGIEGDYLLSTEALSKQSPESERFL